MFALAIAGIALLSFIVGTALAEQTTSFVNDAPTLIDDLEDWLQRNIDEDIELTQVRDQFLNDDGLGEQLTGFADNVVGLGATVIGVVFNLFTIALFTFYLTADGPRLRRTICSRLRPDRQRRILGIWDLAIQKTGGYILSRTVLASISALVTWIAFSIIGVPFPLALAVWVGIVSQFVPVVGVYIAGALPVILTLLESPTKALWALVFMVAYQQFENYLAQGIISASGERYAIEEGPLTRLHPDAGPWAARSEPAGLGTLPNHTLDDRVDADPGSDPESHPDSAAEDDEN